MGKRDTSQGNRVHCKRVWLNDEELWQFNLAQRSTKLGASDFIRQRCLHIVKHKQVGIEQIQLYQELAVLQQQCEQMLKQMQQDSFASSASSGARGSGTVGGDNSDVSHLIEQHFGNIKRLRQRLVKLDSSSDGDSGGSS